jgi:hypothetical protein
MALTVTDRSTVRAIYEVLVAVSIVAFLFYGLRVLFSGAMAEEFERYGLARFRRFTGVLEVLGALGLAAGFIVPGLVVLAAGGLTLLMAAGVVVRFRSGDSLGDALQALAMMVVNLVIFVYAIGLAGQAG